MFLGLSKFCLILGKIACMWEGLCKDWGGKKYIWAGGPCKGDLDREARDQEANDRPREDRISKRRSLGVLKCSERSRGKGI